MDSEISNDQNILRQEKYFIIYPLGTLNDIIYKNHELHFFTTSLNQWLGSFFFLMYLKHSSKSSNEHWNFVLI